MVSPDGKDIAFLSSYLRHNDPRLYVMDLEGDNVRALAPEVIAWGTPPAWSPDGRKLAFVAAEEGGMYRIQRALYVVDLDGGNLTRLGEAWSEVAWSPDGKLLAFAGADPRHDSGNLHVADPGGGEVRMLTEGCTTLAWSPDGREVACGAVGLTVTDVETGQTRLIRENPESGVSRLDVVGLAWSPDGSRLAVRQAPVGDPDPCDRVLLYTINRDGSGFHPRVSECDGELKTASGGSISLLEAESRGVEQGSQ